LLWPPSRAAASVNYPTVVHGRATIKFSDDCNWANAIKTPLEAK
jgi:hypothetical protein